jgi:hypothetical protein
MADNSVFASTPAELPQVLVPVLAANGGPTSLYTTHRDIASEEDITVLMQRSQLLLRYLEAGIRPASPVGSVRSISSVSSFRTASPVPSSILSSRSSARSVEGPEWNWNNGKFLGDCLNFVSEAIALAAAIRGDVSLGVKVLQSGTGVAFAASGVYTAYAAWNQETKLEVMQKYTEGPGNAVSGVTAAVSAFPSKIQKVFGKVSAAGWALGEASNAAQNAYVLWKPAVAYEEIASAERIALSWTELSVHVAQIVASIVKVVVNLLLIADRFPALYLTAVLIAGSTLGVVSGLLNLYNKGHLGYLRSRVTTQASQALQHVKSVNLNATQRFLDMLRAVMQNAQNDERVARGFRPAMDRFNRNHRGIELSPA